MMPKRFVVPDENVAFRSRASPLISLRQVLFREICQRVVFGTQCLKFRYKLLPKAIPKRVNTGEWNEYLANRV